MTNPPDNAAQMPERIYAGTTKKGTLYAEGVWFWPKTGEDAVEYIRSDLAALRQNVAQVTTDAVGRDDVDDIIAAVLQDVAELPDRTSPEDNPDMMLMKTGELELILNRSLAALRKDATPVRDGVESLRNALNAILTYYGMDLDETNQGQVAVHKLAEKALAQRPQNVPDGMVMMPKIPTSKMFVAFITETLKMPESEIGKLPPGAFEAFKIDYKAMVAAAPQQGEE